MRELLAEVNTALRDSRPCVYCAVVETRGSTPQKPGAAMLVFPDGGQVGTLGGGCVEAEVKQRALQALHAGGSRAEVRTFHLDDIHGWDDGLICGGRMTILLDPLPAGTAADYYRRLHTLAERGDGFTEAVVVSDADGLCAGDRYLFDADGALAAQSGPIAPRLAGEAAPLSARPRPAIRGGVAYLPTMPRVAVFLIGGGHVGQATARFAAECGFEIWVLDDREQYVTPERFPSANRRIVGDVGPTLAGLIPSLTPNVYALILTRGHRHDEEALFRLAPSACGYVGMIGSRRKIKLIFEDLIARGLPAEALARVHAPLGLEIGSQTVPEIAVSIVAELIAFRNLGPDAMREGGGMIFAVVPAAGLGSRMGRPKLSLPLGGRTVLDRVIAALRQGGVDAVLAVVGPHDPGLAGLAEAAGASVLRLPEATTDMRATVEQGLRWLEEHFHPRPDDAWLLAPADHPMLDADVVRRLLAAYAARPSQSIMVPVHEGRRGHPTLIAWRHVSGIRAHRAGKGINDYLRSQQEQILEVPAPGAAVLWDLDTPEDYERLRREGGAPR